MTNEANKITTARGCAEFILGLHNEMKQAEENNDWETENEVWERALSCHYGVQVRTGWVDGNTSPVFPDDLAEAVVTLAGGGPACRIYAELDGYGGVDLIKLQAQDWFEPWEDVEVDAETSDALEWFVNLLNLGEVYDA